MCNKERKPHKHAELIKAWADGAEIQWRDPTSYRGHETKGWQDCGDELPLWPLWLEYRVKPEPTDLEKYGVEVGDVWKEASSGYHFVAYVTDGVFRTLDRNKVCLGAASVLIFRRGVVNKL